MRFTVCGGDNHTELIAQYWQVGRELLDRQVEQGWGAKIVDRLAHDLRTSFPNMTGLSTRNLKYMRAFAEAWPDADFVQQAVGHAMRSSTTSKRAVSNDPAER